MTIYGRTIAAQVRGTIEIAAAEVGKFLVISTDAGSLCVDNQRLAIAAGTHPKVRSFINQRGEVVTIQRTV